MYMIPQIALLIFIIFSLVIPIYWRQISNRLDSFIGQLPPFLRWINLPIFIVITWVIIYNIVFFFLDNFESLQYSLIGKIILLYLVYFPVSFAIVAISTLFAPSVKKVVCLLAGILGYIFWCTYPIFFKQPINITVWEYIIPVFSISASVIIVYRTLDSKKKVIKN